MTSLFNLLLLPLRAPMVLVLLVISTYLGLHWSRPGTLADSQLGSLTTLIWSAECLQALVVVVVCTVPELLLRRVATMMAASRVISLVVTLLLVITGGLYLLHLDVLSNVLILAAAVLLARLDLVRLRVVPPPFVMTVALSVLVLGGVSLGRSLEAHLRPWLGEPGGHALPEQRRSEAPAQPSAAPLAGATTPSRAPAVAGEGPAGAGTGAEASPAAAGAAGPAASQPAAGQGAPQATPEAAAQAPPAPIRGPATTNKARSASSAGASGRLINPMIPHLNQARGRPTQP